MDGYIDTSMSQNTKSLLVEDHASGGSKVGDCA